MIQDLNQILLAGGVTHCTFGWTQTGVTPWDECLKLYLPLDGEAEMTLPTGRIQLQTNTVYLFNGARMVSRHCDRSIDIAWMHFTPSSLKLKHMLYKHFLYQQWDYGEISFIKDLLHLIGQVFSSGPDVLRPRKDFDKFKIEDFELCKVQGMLTYLIGEIIQKSSLKSSTQELAVFQRLGPAIDFMDQNADKNPALTDIAGRVFMAPASFHRLFRHSFGITPFEYMLQKRLSKACQLLSTTRLGIKEIALQCGYDDEFYFSRIFKKRFGTSPSDQRNTEWTA